MYNREHLIKHINGDQIDVQGDPIDVQKIHIRGDQIDGLGDNIDVQQKKYTPGN
jgi:hypothetical protein